MCVVLKSVVVTQKSTRKSTKRFFYTTEIFLITLMHLKMDQKFTYSTSIMSFQL